MKGPRADLRPDLRLELSKTELVVTLPSGETQR